MNIFRRSYYISHATCTPVRIALTAANMGKFEMAAIRAANDAVDAWRVVAELRKQPSQSPTGQLSPDVKQLLDDWAEDWDEAMTDLHEYRQVIDRQQVEIARLQAEVERLRQRPAKIELVCAVAEQSCEVTND